MTMQRLCHQRAQVAVACVSAVLLPLEYVFAETPKHDYPTHARVEYVSECVSQSRGQLASLYQCSCVIDRIAASMSYDDYVEASTFSKYSGLGGEGGALFRDSEHGRKLTRLFRDTEAASRQACGLAPLQQ